MSQSTTPNAPVYDAHKVHELIGIYSNADVIGVRRNIQPPGGASGFVTFYDPGWSILVLRKMIECRGRVFCPQIWYDDQPFAKLEERPHYRQLQMEPLKESFGKPFAELQALVPPYMEIPAARVVLMGVVVHYLATGEGLFRDCWVRCVDQTSGGSLVDVGRFDLNGVLVDNDPPDYSDGGIAVALSRKF